MSKESGDDRLSGFAIDQRHAERAIGMRQADKDRQFKTVTALFDPRRKQAEQLARLSARPNQHGAGVAAEDRRRRKQESRLVEDVWL